MQEFKVISTNTFHNSVNEYAIIVTHKKSCMCNAIENTVSLEDPNDMYIIAKDLNKAQELLCEAVSPKFA